jgi:hypothetical protein
MNQLFRKLLIGTFVFALLLSTGSWTRAFAQPSAPVVGLTVALQGPQNSNTDGNADLNDQKDQLNDDRNQDVDQDLNVEVNDEKQDLNADRDNVQEQVGPDVDEVNGANNDVDDRQVDQKDDLQQEVDVP